MGCVIPQALLAFAPPQILAQGGGAAVGAGRIAGLGRFGFSSHGLLVTTVGDRVLRGGNHCGMVRRASQGRRSSVVERTLGKGEVECSIHSGGTICRPTRR